MLAGCTLLVIAMVAMGVCVALAPSKPASVNLQDAEAEHELTESQKQAISAYGPDEHEFVSRLADGIWVNTSETESIEFTDMTFTVTSSGKSETHTYAVQAIEKASENQVSQTQTRSTITASVETEEGVQIFTMNLPVGTQTNPTLKSDYFGQGAFIGTNVGTSLDVVDLEDDFLALFADGGAKLIRDVQLKGAEKYPTATEASWLKECSIDYEDRTITTSFSYNNKNNSKESFEIEF